MKKIYVCLMMFFLLASFKTVAQSGGPKVVINLRGISTFHDLKQLEGMTKGQLIPLYIERVKILFNVIQYFGITSKSGVTFTDLGIPTSKENIKALDSEEENRKLFLENNAQFLTAILPYSDTRNMIKSILFYEEILKMVSQIQNE